MTKICITGKESTPDALFKRLQTVMDECSSTLCELRMDFLSLDFSGSLQFLRDLPGEWSKRLLVTQRLQLTGESGRGECRWSLPEWQDWWYEVAQISQWYAMDIDWVLLDRIEGESVAWSRGRFKSQNILFSHHGDLDSFLPIFPSYLAYLKRYEANAKLALTVSTPNELVVMDRFARKLKFCDEFVLVPMGGLGRCYRLSASAGAWTYVSFADELATAPGQVSWSYLRRFLGRLPRAQYALLSVDSSNRFGEENWNRYFATHQTDAVYLNLFIESDAVSLPLSPDWSRNFFAYLNRSRVKGVSVTQPFKQQFLGKGTVANRKALNTIAIPKGSLRSDSFANTDGPAVLNILQRYFSDLKDLHLLIVGSGGAARAVQDTMTKFRVRTTLWQRSSSGDLPSLAKKNYNAIVSTWPLEHQGKLVSALQANRIRLQNVRIIIDAQLKASGSNTPLGRWAYTNMAQYFDGREWWRKQAFGQAQFWKLFERKNVLNKDLFCFLPSSKSELIRILAICACNRGQFKIITSEFSDDVSQMINALRLLGVVITIKRDQMLVKSSGEFANSDRHIRIEGSATTLRIIICLCHFYELTKTRIDADLLLRRRISADGWSKQVLSSGAWPKKISPGLKVRGQRKITLPKLDTSQYITGYLIAGSKEGAKSNTQVLYSKKNVSLPYVALTQACLREFGKLYRTRRRTYQIEVAPDASSFAYLEVAARYLGYGSLRKDLFRFSSRTIQRQSDWRIVDILDELEKTQAISVDAKEFPDLIPTLFVVACLWGRRLEVKNAALLINKESNRLAAIRRIARVLGAPNSFSDALLVVEGQIMRGPALKTAIPLMIEDSNDHRITMCLALLGLRWENVTPKNPSCVAKSFPKFWEALSVLRRGLP